MNIAIQAVVLSGGSGTRLWPFSRESYPKQFLSFTGSGTLFQDTVTRVVDWGAADSGLFQVLPPLVVCNEMHRFLVAEQLRQLGLEKSPILLEPMGRNTAPALTLAALQAVEQGANPVLLVLPSDHYVANLEGFQQRLAEAIKLAATGVIATFGIVPDKPETGFGYIHRGADLGDNAFVLGGFREKPDAATASEYLFSGEYFWNSGIFILRAQTWLEEIATHRPDILEACAQAMALSKRDGDFIRADKAAFSRCPSDSIDYAVMERLAGFPSETPRAVVLPLDVGWSDLGSWPALTSVRPTDHDGNVMIGDVFTKDTHNSVLYSQSRFVAAVGITDVVVIETTDAVLVAHKDRAQDVKAITDHLKKTERSEHVFHAKVHRPWGNYESIGNGSRYQVKRLTIAPGGTLSLQLHHHRAEHWIVVKGTARVTRGEESFLLTENESTFIPLGVRHRLENPGAIPLEIIEVQSGSYLGEDDIVRFEDRYNRLES
ncbi:mannose-1-phosphate guanylyltransferase/mannose-6-phosphate isomerase [Methylomagnum ishizawai]|uniref:mannose-1-phosphate guanylyltransferase/mannose-6-phosphate isomerase n=1 Tax=Methylomagnum ishizawai TaxID=1760988 RepID=UPI001C32E897|nr:mannose-1-phosphate guanylyltransferase/mannose-6-phosphate isomerase [Methylomagnum ishizawai]BBL75213.1 xanthan biosynthesis protein XanB [Methylomagnum ishizawai]